MFLFYLALEFPIPMEFSAMDWSLLCQCPVLYLQMGCRTIRLALKRMESSLLQQTLDCYQQFGNKYVDSVSCSNTDCYDFWQRRGELYPNPLVMPVDILSALGTQIILLQLVLINATPLAAACNQSASSNYLTCAVTEHCTVLGTSSGFKETRLNSIEYSANIGRPDDC